MKPVGTINLGRNKAKRDARAKGLRHIGKAPRTINPTAPWYSVNGLLKKVREVLND